MKRKGRHRHKLSEQMMRFHQTKYIPFDCDFVVIIKEKKKKKNIVDDDMERRRG